jgi:hypothetical protein
MAITKAMASDPETQVVRGVRGEFRVAEARMAAGAPSTMSTSLIGVIAG